LAVFDKEKLLYIMEFHGCGHINFSDYDETIRDKVFEDNGKPLHFIGTYGKVYANDMAKRRHIEQTYPDAKYIVIWKDDFKKGKMRIDELLKR
jgi:hypothetical protein